MGHFHVIPDVVAVAAARLVAIVRVDNDGSVVVRDLANGGLSTTSASELSAPPALLDPTVAPGLSIVQPTDAQWERARRREAVIADLANASDPADQVTFASARLGVSCRTVFRWLAAYRDAPQTSSLLARPRGTPAGARRIDAHLEQLIAEVIRDVYLTKVRAKKEEVVRQVGLRCSSKRLTPPSRKAILARVHALDTREVAKARLLRAACLSTPASEHRIRGAKVRANQVASCSRDRRVQPHARCPHRPALHTATARTEFAGQSVRARRCRREP